MYKYFYLFIIFGLFLGLGSFANAQTFSQGELCPAEQRLTQNLRTGAYNGEYHPYTNGIVSEAHILQQHLNRLGFNSGKIDGKLGPISDGAIKRMQSYLGLEKIDGIVGPKTRAALNNSCGAQQVATTTPLVTPVANTSSLSRIASIQAELARLAGMIALSKTTSEETTPESKELAKEQEELIKKQIKEVEREVERQQTSRARLTAFNTDYITHIDYDRGSYNEIRIYWQQNERVHSYVQFGENIERLNKYSDIVDVLRHDIYDRDYYVTLNNLDPDTKYYYQIIVEKMDEDNLGIGTGEIIAVSEVKSFKTERSPITTSSLTYPTPELVTNLSPENYTPPTNIPGYLEPFINEQGMKVTRVSDLDTWMEYDEYGFDTQDHDQLGHHYSRDQPWNADQTLIKLSGYPAPILDGDTYELRTDIANNGWASIPSSATWSNTDPDIMYGTISNRLVEYNIQTNEYETLHTFSGFNKVEYGYKGNTSLDDKYIGLIGKNGNNATLITYDIEDDEIIATKYIGNNGLNWFSVSDSGEYVVEFYGSDGSGDNQGIKVMDIDLTNRRHISDWSSHSDIGIDENGDDVYVGWGDDVLRPNNYFLKKIRLSDGLMTPMFYWTQSSAGVWNGHISLRNNLRPGYAYINEGCCWTNPSLPMELFSIKLSDGNTIERFGQTNANTHPGGIDTYSHQAHAVPNRDGTKIMFKSNWFNDTWETYGKALAWIVESE